MVRRVVGTVAAASALTANALLIPPGVQSLDQPVKLQLINSDWQVVKLPCPECVIPSPVSGIKDEAEGDAPVFIQGASNSLLVNITTLFGGNAVGLPGDYPLYPPLASFNKASVDIVPSEASLVDLQATSDRRHTVKVSASSAFVDEEQVNPDGDAVIRLKYHIVSVDNHPVTVDAVQVTCLKTGSGKMAIIKAMAVPSPSTIFDSLLTGEQNSPPAPGKKQCSLPPLLCHWREFVESKLSGLSHGMPKHFGFRPCAGRKGKGKGRHGGHKGHKGPKGHHPHKGHNQPEGHDGVWKDEQGVSHLPGHIRPPPRLPQFTDDDRHSEGHGVMDGRPHHRPHGGFWAHHRHHHHMPFHGLVRGFLMVLIPIFLGITMGMTVSLLGMIVGRLIAFVWMRFVRGGRRGYASVQLSEEEAEHVEATKEEFDEPLPLYEDAPAYEEKPAELK